ncbi:MAG TPA: hypothetical protein VHN14_07900 [Kofleriaceae bacterium]|nr:hypothetical protein [Kofleriaceae bacterium]
MRAVGVLTIVGLTVLGPGLGPGLGKIAGAQPRHGGGAPGPAERAGVPPAGAPTGTTGAIDRREQIKKKIRAMRAYTLTEELALDERTAGTLFPVLSRYDDETDKLLEKRVDVQRRLRHVDSIKDGKAIERLLDEAVAIQRSFWDLEDRRVADLRKVLTPMQTAKLLVVLPALERRIQNQLRKAIVKRHTAGSGDDEDDDKAPDELPPPSSKPPLRRREAPLGPRGGPSNAPGNTSPCTPNAEPCR